MTSTITAGITTLAGDPDAIRASGRRWRTAAMACAAAAAQGGAVAVVDGFLGDESGTWEQRLQPETSTLLSILATARDIIGGALVTYAGVLEDCQQELRGLTVHRAEAGSALDRWRATPTAEPDLVDSATQTVHDLDARSAAVVARHAAAVRACCVQIDRATAMAPGRVAGVRPGVTAVRVGSGPGRFRQSSNAVMAGLSLSHPAQLSAIGPFLATDNPRDTDSTGQWIDPATRDRYYQLIFEHCMVKQSFMGNGMPDEGLGLAGGCQGYANSALTSDQTLIQVLNDNPGLIAMIPLPKTTFGSVWNDYMGMLRDMGSMTVDGVTTYMFSGCKEGGSIGACLFDIASAPFPFAKGAKAVKAGVELVEDGADVVKAGEKATDVKKAASEADRGTDAARTADSDGVALTTLRVDADRIANGHAWEKHVMKKREFPDVHSREEFAELIADVIVNGERRQLRDGRVAYWKDDTLVIRNPRDGDGGSAYRPDDGYEYFETLR